MSTLTSRAREWARHLWPSLLLSGAPLLILPWGFDAREAPRVALACLLGAITLVGLTGRLALRVPAWAWPWGLACLVAPFFAAAPAHETLLGALPAAPGTVLWLSYAVVLLGSLAPEERAVRRWLALGLTVIELGVALAQLTSDRPVTGTFGHPVFLGAWGALGAAVGAGLSWDLRGGARALALVGLVAGAACVALAARRGPLLMLIAALVGAWLVVRPPAKRWLPAALLVASLLLALSVLPRAELGGDAALARWLTRTEEARATVAARVVTFRETWRLIASRPLTGYGPSTFADAAATWTTPGDSHYEARPHSVVLLVAHGLGLPATAAFVVFCALALLAALRAARAAPPEERGSTAAAAALMPAYGLHLMVNVDQPGVGLWVCAIFATAWPWPATRAGEVGPRLVRAVPAAALAVAGLLPVLASVALDLGQRRAAAGDFVGASAHFRLADVTRSTGCLARRSWAVAERARDALRSAPARFELLAACAARRPDDWLSRYHRGLALADAGRGDEAVAELAAVVAAVPGLDEVQLELAALLARRGELARAVDTLHPERARPAYRGLMWRMRGELFDALEDARSALYAYERALTWLPDDPTVRGRIAELKGVLPP